MDKTIRLDKYLASLGVCSRRAVEQLLIDKTVTVNGKKVVVSGTRIDPHTDSLLINGAHVRKPQLKYYLLNKPKGYISTNADEHSRKNVTSLIKTNERIYPVGRLDKDTSGLLILTNDGELTNLLTHPRYHVPKTYQLTVAGTVAFDQIQRLQKGVVLEDGKTAPAQVKIIRKTPTETILTMTIHEGKNRQIRRMCAAVNINLKELERIAIGKLRALLKPGQYRKLSRTEINATILMTSNKQKN